MTRAARSRVVYRGPVQNAFLAFAFVAPLLLATSWWSLAYVFLVGGIATVRCARRSVVVTDDALVERRVLATQVVPWWQPRELSISHRTSRRQTFTTTTSGLDFRVVVHNAKKGVLFSDAVDRALATARPGPSHVWPPSRAYRRMRVALWTCLFGVLLGAAWLRTGLWERGRYEARAARDRTAVATVARSRIVEHDHSEGGTTYSTRAAIVFDAGGRHVATTIERSGRHRFPAEFQLPIVYDPLYANDADFGDRPNRTDDAASARAAIWVGTVMGTIGVVAGAVLGTLMLWTWQRHRGRSTVRPRASDRAARATAR